MESNHQYSWQCRVQHMHVALGRSRQSQLSLAGHLLFGQAGLEGRAHVWQPVGAAARSPASPRDRQPGRGRGGVEPDGGGCACVWACRESLTCRTDAGGTGGRGCPLSALLLSPSSSQRTPHSKCMVISSGLLYVVRFLPITVGPLLCHTPAPPHYFHHPLLAGTGPPGPPVGRPGLPGPQGVEGVFCRARTALLLLQRRDCLQCLAAAALLEVPGVVAGRAGEGSASSAAAAACSSFLPPGLGWPIRPHLPTCLPPPAPLSISCSCLASACG